MAVFGALIALNTLWLLKLVGLARARMQSGGGGDVSIGSGKAAGLALDAADAAQCKAMASAAQRSGGAGGAQDAASDLIKSCTGSSVGGSVVSLSARAGSMSAVEAAAHAAAFAAARGQSKQLPASTAAPRQGCDSQGGLHGASEQGKDWMRSMGGEPNDMPAVASAADGGGRGTGALTGKLQAMPSLGRQGMIGPLEAVAASGSDKWGDAHTRSRHKARCDCAFC